jgi:hypothetical protein
MMLLTWGYFTLAIFCSQKSHCSDYFIERRMNKTDYTDFEWRLFAQADWTNREIELSQQQGEMLIRSGFYRRSMGFPYEATQYRRSNADGSCLHLVWREGLPRLHRDKFDPHRDPLSMYMHVTNEAPFEAAATCALAWSLIKFLAR